MGLRPSLGRDCNVCGAIMFGGGAKAGTLPFRPPFCRGLREITGMQNPQPNARRSHAQAPYIMFIVIKFESSVLWVQQAGFEAILTPRGTNSFKWKAAHWIASTVKCSEQNALINIYLVFNNICRSLSALGALTKRMH